MKNKCSVCGKYANGYNLVCPVCYNKTVSGFHPKWKLLGGPYWIAKIEDINVDYYNTDIVVKKHLKVLLNNNCKEIMVIIHVAEDLKESLWGLI